MPIDLYTPRTLWGVITKMPKVNTFLRDTFFKQTITFPTKSVEFDVFKGGRQLAPFIHPRMGTEIIENAGYKTKSYTPAEVGAETITTADDLMMRVPGENPYSGRTPASRAVEKLSYDLQKLDEAITRREEWMCAQVLTTGTIPVVGKGINETINFSFTNTVTLTNASDKWSSNTAPIMDQVNTWKRTIQRDGYVNPTMLLMNSNTADYLLKNKEIQTMLDNRRYELGTMAPRTLQNGASYLGRLARPDIDIIEYNEVYYDDWTDPENPATKLLIPDGKVILASEQAQFSKLYGAHTYLDENQNWQTYMGERIPDSWIAKSPDRRMLALYSHPLMVPHEVDSWIVATVL